jgi:hypothetical protein
MIGGDVSLAQLKIKTLTQPGDGALLVGQDLAFDRSL